MIRPVFFHPAARLELLDAVRYLKYHSPEAVKSLQAHLEDSLRQVSEFPFSTPVYRADIRKKVLVRYPYIIYYRVTDDQVRILAFAHQRRQPEYWADREGDEFSGESRSK